MSDEARIGWCGAVTIGMAGAEREGEGGEARLIGRVTAWQARLGNARIVGDGKVRRGTVGEAGQAGITRPGPAWYGLEGGEGEAGMDGRMGVVRKGKDWRGRRGRRGGECQSEDGQERMAYRGRARLGS